MSVDSGKLIADGDAITKSKEEIKPVGLDLLRAPFPENQISKLPKPTKKQTDIVRNDYTKGIRCQVCGGWHHPKVVHLDYVGHAALTDRLLECDPHWNWEPMAFSEQGTPLQDANGGMWIKLTVCGVTRLGYGHPDGKRGGDAVKEVIGDAMRNAAMRFGAALDLWHKGQLHQSEDEPEEPKIPQEVLEAATGAETLESLAKVWSANKEWQKDPAFLGAKDKRKAELQEPKPPKKNDLDDDHIPF